MMSKCSKWICQKGQMEVSWSRENRCNTLSLTGTTQTFFVNIIHFLPNTGALTSHIHECSQAAYISDF